MNNKGIDTDSPKIVIKNSTVTGNIPKAIRIIYIIQNAMINAESYY